MRVTKLNTGRKNTINVEDIKEVVKRYGQTMIIFKDNTSMLVKESPQTVENLKQKAEVKKEQAEAAAKAEEEKKEAEDAAAKKKVVETPEEVTTEETTTVNKEGENTDVLEVIFK